MFVPRDETVPVATKPFFSDTMVPFLGVSSFTDGARAGGAAWVDVDGTAVGVVVKVGDVGLMGALLELLAAGLIEFMLLFAPR